MIRMGIACEDSSEANRIVLRPVAEFCDRYEHASPTVHQC